MYQQPLYTPFQQSQDYTQQGMQNSGQGNSGLIGGLLKSYLGTVTGGLIGGGGGDTTPAFEGAGQASQAYPQMPAGGQSMDQQAPIMSMQGMGAFLNQYMQTNTPYGNATDAIGKKAGWWE